MKSSQSNFYSRSPSSYLARSYLIATVVMEDWLCEYILSEMLLQREWGWGAEGALTHPEFWASEKRTEREIWTNLRIN